MDELAQRLKAERLGRGWTLKDISDRARISITVLKTLEAGKFENIGAPYIVDGLLKSYSSALGIDPATVVRTVDSLEKRGLIERRRDRQDRRQVFVEFTDAGRAARLEAHQQFIERIRAIFLSMSAEGRASLLNGLEEFVQVGLEVRAEQEREPEKHMSYP